MAGKLPRAAYLVLGFVMNLTLGTVYSWSVISSTLTSSTGPYKYNTFSANIPFAVALAMFSVGMVFSGRLVDRAGPRKVALVGAVLVGAGYMLSSLFSATPWPLWALTATFGVVAGLGIGFAYNPPIATAVRWFPVRKGLASGVVVMGFGLSPVLTATVVSWYMIPAFGLSTTLLILGAVYLVVLLACASLLSFPEPGWLPPEKIVAAAGKRTWKPVAELTTREMVHSSSFWGAWVLYALGTAGGFMAIGNAGKIASEIGHVPAALLTVPVIVLAIFNSSGRPLFGRVADVLTPKRALLIMYAVLLAGMGILSVANSDVTVYLGIALTGIVFGGFLAVMPALSTLFFGAKNQAANYGVLFTGYGLGAIVALFVGAFVRTETGSYLDAFYLSAFLAVLGIALSLSVRPPKPVAVKVEKPIPAQA